MKDAATQRSKGLIEEVSGKIKKRIGKLVGNEPMQAKGHAKEIKGKVRQASAKASERARGATVGVVGEIKRRVGRAIENGQKQVQIKARGLKGKTGLERIADAALALPRGGIGGAANPGAREIDFQFQ